MRRVSCLVRGTVQGVGFRPFLFGLARSLGLSGWVRNVAAGVYVEVQGDGARVDSFLERVRQEAPRGAHVEDLTLQEVASVVETGFHILRSESSPDSTLALTPDVAMCASCRNDVTTPGNRRCGYLLTTCAACGPRYAIAASLPFDRDATTMRVFPPCRDCAEEYGNPDDRRFHAQTIACAACGPRVRFHEPGDGPSSRVAEEGQAIAAAVQRLLRGEVVAVKGVSGFHLCVDATNGAAVAHLRRRKGRPDKPFAVMFGSIEQARRYADLSSEEEATLVSAAAPIVLVRWRPRSEGPPLAPGVAPATPSLGVLLAYTGLHEALLRGVGRPLVCTSGNRTEEPLCHDNGEAVERLAGIADAFLVHDREIVRPLDDSVVRVLPAQAQTLRRARGFVPDSLRLRDGFGDLGVLALGGHLKSSVTVLRRGQAWMSQYLGDLTTLEACLTLRSAVAGLLDLTGIRPRRVACDVHPEYASSLYAQELATAWGARLVPVQHHHAHAAAVIAEHGLREPVLAFVWDGAGWGSDGTVWGGEVLIVDGARYQRVAHLRPFPLLGGDAAMREPRRSALGLLATGWENAPRQALGEMFGDAELESMATALRRGVGTVITSSMGRLFDGVAALCGLGGTMTYEGQAAMALEMAADMAEGKGREGDPRYRFELRGESPILADWRPLVGAVVDDRRQGLDAGVVAVRFHLALLGLVRELARRFGLEAIVLSGGCFQNRRLLVEARQGLVEQGHRVYSGERYPVNDGGLSLGQAYVASW